MYRIRQDRIGNYDAYVLVDESSGADVTVIPERGGIIAGFSIAGEEILYMDYETLNDPGKNVRGGIPVLFPICGSLQNGSFEKDNRKYFIGNHGFARNYPWQTEDIITDDASGIVLSFKSCSETKKVYPFDFEVVFKYILKGNRLLIKQEYKNLSDKPMPFYAGFHPYFNVSGRNDVKYGINAETCYDSSENRAAGYDGRIVFPDHDTSKILLDIKGNSLWFADRKLNRKIEIQYGSEFKYIVVWSIKDKNFICVEPWMAMPDAMNSGKDLYLLGEGKILNTEFSICCRRFE